MAKTNLEKRKTVLEPAARNRPSRFRAYAWMMGGSFVAGIFAGDIWHVITWFLP